MSVIRSTGGIAEYLKLWRDTGIIPIETPEPKVKEPEGSVTYGTVGSLQNNDNTYRNIPVPRHNWTIGTDPIGNELMDNEMMTT